MVVLNVSILLTMIWEQITKYTVGCDGHIVVTPPLQASPKFVFGVRNSVYDSLFPAYVRDQIDNRSYSDIELTIRARARLPYVAILRT